MKKALIALFATIGLIFGSVALTSPAQAKVYPGTVKTKSSASAPKTVKSAKKFTVKIKVSGGNSKAQGTVVVRINGKNYKATVKNGVATVKVTAPKLSKKTKSKKYKISVKFTPKKGTVHKASSTTKSITIKKK